MTRQEILDKTISTYNSNNRCSNPDNGGCYYYGGSVSHFSPGCGIGQLLPEELSIFLDNIKIGGIGALIDIIMDVESAYNSDGDKILSIINKYPYIKIWLNEENRSFLIKIQRLHDGANYWGSDGITQEGLNFAKSIREEYIK